MSDNTTRPPDASIEANEELDPTVEDEINRDATQADAMNLDGANDAEPAAVNGVSNSTTAFEARIPAKKDATLREFLGKMDEYAPIVSCTRLPGEVLVLTATLDPRCSHELLSDTSRSPPTAADLAPPCPPPRSRDPEIHCGHRSRRIPVLSYSVVK